ncbi:hypothetical protein ILYODFUR_014376 [Ilyodon furcidens]|uniref:Uncharacterized protein n=1 Tax=Ilyodon furcidens TaxID=33524 RepID=A0ABV0SWZ3_9TELE
MAQLETEEKVQSQLTPEDTEDLCRTFPCPMSEWNNSETSWANLDLEAQCIVTLLCLTGPILNGPLIFESSSGEGVLLHVSQCQASLHSHEDLKLRSTRGA